jgi:hypothetical protein
VAQVRHPNRGLEWPGRFPPSECNFDWDRSGGQWYCTYSTEYIHSGNGMSLPPLGPWLPTRQFPVELRAIVSVMASLDT